MIWERERFLAHCKGEFTGREMFCELFGPLAMLEKEWRIQGALEDEINLTAFDFDYVLKSDLAVNCFALTHLEKRIISDTDTEQITIDTMGRTSKLCKESATIPLPLTHPVTEMEDWLAIKHWYAFSEERIDREALQHQNALHQKGYLNVLNIPGAFDEPRQLLGEEEVCVACYTDPEMLHDMLDTMKQNVLQIIEQVAAITPIDYVFIHEDMAGKSGPLWGPIQAQEFMVPYYTEIWAAAKAAGAQVFSQDSDGNMNPIMDDLVDCQLTSIHPCEPASGMDIVQLRQKYGNKLLLKGGIDKYPLRAGKEEILKELEYKICDVTKGGGVIFALDHRIPNGVSIENYRYYVNTARELLGLEGISGKGWARMAF